MRWMPADAQRTERHPLDGRGPVEPDRLGRAGPMRRQDPHGVMRLEPSGDIDHRRQARPVQPAQVVDRQQDPAAEPGDRPERFEGAARDGRLVGRPARRVLQAEGDGERPGLRRREVGPDLVEVRGQEVGEARVREPRLRLGRRAGEDVGAARTQLVGRPPTRRWSCRGRAAPRGGASPVRPPGTTARSGRSRDLARRRRASATPRATAGLDRGRASASRRPRGSAMVSECTDGPRSRSSVPSRATSREMRQRRPHR